MPEKDTTHRNKLTTALAWLCIVLGGYHTFGAAYDNLTLSVMLSSSGFMMSLASATLPVELPPLARFFAAHIRTVFVFYFIMSFTVFVLGLGLLKRKRWALEGFYWLLYCWAAIMLLVFVFPWILLPKPYIYQGVSIAPEFNAAVSRLRWIMQSAAAILCVGFFWFARRLERADIRKEFGIMVKNEDLKNK